MMDDKGARSYVSTHHGLQYFPFIYFFDHVRTLPIQTSFAKSQHVSAPCATIPVQHKKCNFHAKVWPSSTKTLCTSALSCVR